MTNPEAWTDNDEHELSFSEWRTYKSKLGALEDSHPLKGFLDVLDANYEHYVERERNINDTISFLQITGTPQINLSGRPEQPFAPQEEI